MKRKKIQIWFGIVFLSFYGQDWIERDIIIFAECNLNLKQYSQSLHI